MGPYPSPGQPWHHYPAWGHPSPLAPLILLLSMIVLLVILSAARWVVLWGVARADAWRTRPKSAPAPGPLSEGAEDPQPVPVLEPVLASDCEREETTRLVSEAIGEGRLSLEEGERRIDSALRSRHRHQLASLVADLPPTLPASTPPVFAALRPGLLAVAANAILAAVLVQAVAGLWELWPLAVVALGASALVPRR
jgi:hypothetical protein